MDPAARGRRLRDDGPGLPRYLRRRRAERAAEATWMTPYFTAAVWISLAMVWP
ncbi:hypothetical protein L6R53_11780 [Myxococcota bacterium]|nr:hypothetical protein [Myxococcota bacterium]